MKAMGLIFTNDASLGELTNKRTMASIPFGGRYRQVDFALSNLTAAGIRRVGIVSQHNYQSLMNHIGDGEEWGLELQEGGLEFLTPFAMSTTHNYRGKLESISAAMDFLNYGADDDLVIAIDSAIVANMDLTKILQNHIQSGKDVTVVTKSGIANGETLLDLALKLDDHGEIQDILVDYAAPQGYLASMDVFVMSRKFLITQVKELIARNRFHMDRDLILGGWQAGKVSVNVFPFEGHVMTNESVQEYFANSMALIDKDVRHDIFGANHPVYTKVRDRVPSYYGDSCDISNCIVADGCVLEGHAAESVLFRSVSIRENAKVDHCVIMNDAVIGEGADLQYVILDKNITVRPGAKLAGTAQHPIIIEGGETV